MVLDDGSGVFARSQHRYSDFLRLHGELKATLRLTAFRAPKLLVHSSSGLQLRRLELQRFLDEVVGTILSEGSTPPQLSIFLGLAAGGGHGITRRSQDASGQAGANTAVSASPSDHTLRIDPEGTFGVPVGSEILPQAHASSTTHAIGIGETVLQQEEALEARQEEALEESAGEAPHASGAPHRAALVPSRDLPSNAPEQPAAADAMDSAHDPAVTATVGADGSSNRSGEHAGKGWSELLRCLPLPCIKEIASSTPEELADVVAKHQIGEGSASVGPHLLRAQPTAKVVGAPAPLAATEKESRANASVLEPMAASKGSLAVSPLLEGHVKARGQDNPTYPQRQPVADHLVPWDATFPGYSPNAWTDPVVLANSRELSTGEWWADPSDASRAGLEQRVSYAGDGRPKMLVLNGGIPRNPVGRTGLRGRGLLGKWGPNQAADPIVTRYHPDTNKLQVVAIRRKDTGQWAIPGGMVDDGEAVSATVRREFIEEAGNITGAEARARFETQVHPPHCPPPCFP